MTRFNSGRGIGAFTAVAYLVTAGMHSTGYGPVTAMTADASADLQALVPLLWLAFSCDLVLKLVSAVLLAPEGLESRPLSD